MRDSATGAMLALLVAGCAAGPGATRPVASAEPAAVVYEVAGHAAAPLRVGLAARADAPQVQLVSFRDGATPSRDEAEGPAADLDHPVYGRLEIRQVGNEAVARLELSGGPREAARSKPPSTSRQVDRAPGVPAGRSVGPAAVYELRVPAAELTLILDDLDAAGAFSELERPDGGARLAVDPARPPKEWTPEPRLDDLVERVIREGQRVPGRLPAGVGRARVTATVAVPPAPRPKFETPPRRTGSKTR